MKSPLRILHLEDNEIDRDLVARTLGQARLDPQITLAGNRDEFLSALAASSYDLVLSDFSLPGFDGLSALHLFRERDTETPFIFVSGTIGEDRAVQALHRGATDYVLKDRLARLPSAVERALDEREVRHARRKEEERTQAEAAFTRRTQDAIVEASDDAMVGIDVEGLITRWNSGAERLHGYTGAEALGRSLVLLAPPDRQDEMLGLIRHIREGKAVRPFETVRMHKDGRRLDVTTTLSVVRDARGTIVGAASISRDIGERKHLEAQLRQAHKMEAIGHLAGGVAHDFNNILNVIVGHAELLLRAHASDSPERRHTLEIHKAAGRAASLTRPLLAFSRKQVLAPVVLDVNALVHDLENMLRRMVTEDIELVSRLDPDALCIRADASQIEQVLMNLVINARDAMPDGGRLTITTRSAVLDPAREYMPPDMPSGVHVVLSVADTGHGMDEVVRSQIFEPFFTTKETGKGTGLGLATVYGVVRQSGGHIHVETEVGRGTTFTIYLPRADSPAPARWTDTVESGLPTGTETVLIVEDESDLREIVATTLESAGYVVLTAERPQDAVERVRAHPGPIDLLLSDVIMPQMNGPELAAKLQAIRPDLKVVFMSGYSGDIIARGAGPEPYLEKPFSSSALTRKLRDVLDSS